MHKFNMSDERRQVAKLGSGQAFLLGGRNQKREEAPTTFVLRIFTCDTNTRAHEGSKPIDRLSCHSGSDRSAHQREHWRSGPSVKPCCCCYRAPASPSLRHRNRPCQTQHPQPDWSTRQPSKDAQEDQATIG